MTVSVVKPISLGLPAEQYHADQVGDDRPSLSASIAHLLCTKSPLHAWTAHPKLNPDYQRIEDDKFDLGTCVHALLLERRPVDELVCVVEADDWRTKAARAERDAAREAGLIPLLTKHVERVRAMVVAAGHQIAAFSDEPALFVSGKPERTIVWEEGDVLCRARIDWLHDDLETIDDLKTTSGSADPDRWSRTMFTIGADVQAAFYLRGLRVLGADQPSFRFVVQETYPPYALSVNSLGPDVMAVAERKVSWAIERWRLCVQRDVWAAYPDATCFVELPAWEEARWLEFEAREEIAA